MEPVIALVILPAAFILDMFIGDPRWLPHPVRWMGKAIILTEPFFRKIRPNLVFAGILFAATMVLLTWAASFLVVKSGYYLHPLCGIGIEIVLIYYAISARSLRDSAQEVGEVLSRQTLQDAREKLAWIVGRDVQQLTPKGVIRAAVETVAENLIDGVVSPLIYAAIGGAPLAMAYKMINTLDSMVGYKNEKYIEFGKASARLDDAANYIPARLALPVISVAAQILYRRGTHPLNTARKEGRNHASPNAGFSEAAFAGALSVKLGGANYYHGTLVHKPHIGVLFGDAEIGHIKRANNLMLLSAALWLALVWGVQWFLSV
jgi:adenosylcobinamide-phosphate synthase